MGGKSKLEAKIQSRISGSGIDGWTVCHKAGVRYIRFPMNIPKQEVLRFWNMIGLTAGVSDFPLSGSFSTFSLSDGHENLYYVNNSRLAATSGMCHFNTKDLTPAKLGITGKYTSMEDFAHNLFSSLNSKYPDHRHALMSAVGACARGDLITPTPEPLKRYAQPDLNTISKDFGEVLSAVSMFKICKGDYFTLPKSIHLPMVDFFIGKVGRDIPFSVKSGKGSSNSLKFLSDVSKNALVFRKDPQPESSPPFRDFLEGISTRTPPDGIIYANALMHTQGFKYLSQAMDIEIKDISRASIDAWLGEMDFKTKVMTIKRIHKYIESNVSKKTWDNAKKLDNYTMVLLNPFGYHVLSYLNKTFGEEINTIMRWLDLSQVNISVDRYNIKMKYERGKDAEYSFDYHGSIQGHTSSNKIGFRRKC